MAMLPWPEQMHWVNDARKARTTKELRRLITISPNVYIALSADTVIPLLIAAD
jgi:hypothetical protein